MTNFLVRHGHDIKKVDNSEKDAKFKVFLFEDTEKLRATMSKFDGQEV